MTQAVPPRELLEELGELIASGVDAYVATRDAENEPESMLAMGARLHAGRGVLTVYLPEALASATLANLEENADVAVTLVRPPTCAAAQIKGKRIGVRPSDETDREFQAIFRGALIEALEIVGIPRSTTRRLTWWPSVAVEIEIRDIFTQTPGPGAGNPMVRS
jgi:hypothetical protein